MKVKVNAGYQLGLDGEDARQPGEILNVPDALAEQWIAAGQATAVKGEKAVAKPKAVKAAKNKVVTESANKAVSQSYDKPSFVSTPTVVDTPGPIVKKG